MKKFLVVCAGWNCAPYIKSFMQGLKSQTYRNFCVVIIDDASTDNTAKLLHEELLNGFDLQYHIHTNKINKGGYYSYNKGMEIAKEMFNYDVVTWHGLDDNMLPRALQVHAEEYEKGNIVTYGTYINKNGFIFKDLFYPEEVHLNRTYRLSKFRPTALRTFKKELYDLVPKYEQCDVERKIYYDLEMGMSLLEMAGKDRIGVITEPIYEYNNLRPDSCANLYGRDIAVYNKICSRKKRDLYVG